MNQLYATDADLLAGLRNMLVNPRDRTPGFASADAFSVVVAASTNRVNVPLGSLRRGWWLFQSTDAWLTLRQSDNRTGPTSSQKRDWRLGPASRAAVYVEEDTSFSYVVAAVTNAVTVDPTTGFVATATAAPTLTGWWAGNERPPRDTRSGCVAFDDGLGALADQSSIDSATPMIAYPPGFASRALVVASSSVVCSIWDGSAAGAVVGELPAARSHELASLDPWLGVRLSVAAGSADAWLSWSDL